MARKFNNPPSNKKTQGGSYNSPPGRNTRIQKDTKKEQIKPHTNPHKIIPQPSSNTSQTIQKFIPTPPPAPVQSKPLTQAGKNNLAKLASISKLMGTNLPMNNIKISSENPSQPNPKNAIKKPSNQQVFQAIESLKELEKLLDSYQELQMDHNSNLKMLLQFMQQRNVNNETEKQQKPQA